MQEEDAAGFDDIVDIADYQPAGSFERQLRDYKVRLGRLCRSRKQWKQDAWRRAAYASRVPISIASFASPSPNHLYAEHNLRESVTA